MHNGRIVTRQVACRFQFRQATSQRADRCAVSKPFIDSHVVLYLLSGDIAKANRAQQLLQDGGIVSVEVLNEVTSVCQRKLKMP